MIFSVIIPFLNEEEYIESCVGSLLSQDFNKQEYELIFVDNGSQDRSSGILRKFPGLTLLHEGRKNEYIARNTAVKIAKGQIMAFINADCLAGRSWLTQIYQGMIKYDADIALGRVSFPGDNLFLKTLGDYENSKLEYIISNCERKIFFGWANNMAIKADVFKSIGLFSDWHRAGDTELIQSYIAVNPDKNSIIYLSDAEVTHLELISPMIWLGKIYMYGEHNRFAQQKTNYRPINLKLKFEVLRNFLKTTGHSFKEKLFLLPILVIGVFFYKSGELKAYIKYTFHKVPAR